MRNILIDNHTVDVEKCSFSLPWNGDANCFNFIRPTEFVLDTEMRDIDPLDVESLVIGCDIDDYGVVKKMTNLEQLYIYAGNNLKDLNFITSLSNLNQLYISKSEISNLNGLDDLMKLQKSIFDTQKEKRKWKIYGLYAICINSSMELDGGFLQNSELYVSEIIINGRLIVQ